MNLLVLSGADVRTVLSHECCADAMRQVLVARARGEVFQPLRSVLRPDTAPGLMALMPSYQSGAAAGYGLKAICITPGNPAIGLDSHQGIVLLSSPQTGEPLAVLNASAITEIRTAAVSVVATSLLARAEADVLAIVGTGVQARSHLQALAASRPLAEIRIAGSSPARAQAFASENAADSIPLRPCDSVREAVADAGIIVTATSSGQPVLRREWIAAGAHINAVGACLPHLRELDTPTVAGAALFADSRESMLSEAGDYLLAAADGAVGPGHVRAEIGDLLAGLAPGMGRRDEEEVTIFESLGLAAEDLAASFVAYQNARELGKGMRVEFD